MIALLSGFATSGSLSAHDVGKTLIQLTAFLGVLLVAGLIIVPRLLNYIARFKSNETLLITVVGLCFGVALLAVKLGYSVALGAFLIGAIIAEARQIGRIEALTHPVRDLFSAVFFVSIGLLIDPALLLQYWIPIVIISAVVIVGKLIACSFGAFISGNDLRTSVRVGMGLAQIGEFSFIIAAMGLSLKVTSEFLYPIAVAVSALTTLTTPYLVRSSDWLVSRVDRVAPATLLNSLEVYTRWTGRLGATGNGSIGLKLLRRWGLQIGLNLILVTGVFIAANFLRERAFAWLGPVPGGDNSVKAILWLSAMLASLPMLIAVFRKLQATGMLVSEMSVASSVENAGPLRAVLSHAVLIAGCIGLSFFLLILSTAILPSWNVLLVLALVIVVAVIIMRRSLIQLHAKAQIALQETFAHPAAGHEKTPAALPPALREAELLSVPIPQSSRAHGRMIGEMRLRSKTGASVVSIERSGGNIINPSPDEEVQGGDTLILLGSRQQLESAREYLNQAAAA